MSGSPQGGALRADFEKNEQSLIFALPRLKDLIPVLSRMILNL